MPKYLIRARYTDQAARGLAKEGALKRRDSAEGPIRQMGGTVAANHFALVLWGTAAGQSTGPLFLGSRFGRLSVPLSHPREHRRS